MTNILFLGELVGRCGISSLKAGLAGIKTKYSVDYTIINGEGMTNGYGIGKQHSMQLGKLGIDLTTGGEKMFYKPDFVEFMQKCSFVLRPLNYPPQCPGKGAKNVTINKSQFLIINLQGHSGMKQSIQNAFVTMESFLKKGFYTIGALRTNRILYPDGIRSKASEIAKTLKPSDTSLVTVGGREFYIWRYEGHLNGITNAVVLLSYPKNAFGQKQALRMFISTNVGLSTQEILDLYVKRWPIEVFFRNSKSKLALDTYQIRSQKGIERYWLIMSFTHYLCCICKGGYCSFEEGYQYLAQSVAIEHLEQLYKLSKSCSSFEAFSQATSGCFVHFSKFAHL